MSDNNKLRYKLWIRIVEIIAAAIVGILGTLAATGCSSMGDVQWNGRLLRHPETPFTEDVQPAPSRALTPKPPTKATTPAK